MEQERRGSDTEQSNLDHQSSSSMESNLEVKTLSENNENENIKGVDCPLLRTSSLWDTRIGQQNQVKILRINWNQTKPNDGNQVEHSDD